MEDKKTPLPVAFLVPVFLVLMVALPAAIALGPILLVEQTWLKIAFAALSPVIFSAAYVLVTGLLSNPFHKAIVPGKFPRNVTHFVYGPRRLYGLTWGAVFYFTPVYYAFTSMAQLRKFMLRIFGYTGDTDITLAPDAWIRDLPCLHFSQGTYIANKSTIGTNMCLSNGSILVDQVKTGTKAMIGHLAIVGPGTRLGDNSEIGVSAALGIRITIGNRTRIGPRANVNHGAMLGDDVEVGANSYVGVKARVGNGVKLSSASTVPDGAEIKSDAEMAAVAAKETEQLLATKGKLQSIYSARMHNLKQSG